MDVCGLGVKLAVHKRETVIRYATRIATMTSVCSYEYIQTILNPSRSPDAAFHQSMCLLFTTIWYRA